MGLLSRWRSRDLVPARERDALVAEGVVIEEKNVSLTVRFRDFRAPGRIHQGRITRFRSAVVLTEARLVVFMGADRLLDAAFGNPLTGEALEMEASDEGLALGFDPAAFDPHRSGRVDVLARVPDPPALLAAIQARTLG